MENNLCLEISGICKKYKDGDVLKDINLNVEKGKIFGLLGPNGAGKTTLLRIVTGILMADAGFVNVNGVKTDLVNNAKFIGYMPEERGLYKKMKVEEQAMYLSQLKGLPYSKAKANIQYWFDKLDMNDWKNKKIDEISKGMAQKLQFVCTVVHEPNLIILDEPFSGLDPLNAEIIKNEIFYLSKEKGASIIFSTHRMEQVEEICEEIALVNNGEIILNDNINSAKDKYYNQEYEILYDTDKLPEDTTLYEIVSDHNNTAIIKINADIQSDRVLAELASKHIGIRSFSKKIPTLNQIFINLVKKK